MYHVLRTPEMPADICSKYLAGGCNFRKLGIIIHYVVCLTTTT